MNNAPPVAFSKDPPMELRGAPGLRNSPDLVGYLSLAIFPSHVDTLEKRVKAASLVQGLYANIFIIISNRRKRICIFECASAWICYFKVVCFFTVYPCERFLILLCFAVLNRAHPEKDPAKSTKKTITGRTFARA